MLPVSLEAIEDLAWRVRAAHVALARAALDGNHEPVGRPPPDASRLSRAYPLARASDPALGVLVAEAVVMDALRRSARAYETAWASHPVVLAGETPVPVAALWSVLVMTPDAPRRGALARVADQLAKDHLGVARPLVDALRAVGDALGLDAPSALHSALGLGDGADVERAYSAVLSATDEVYRELEPWARARSGIVSRTGELTWEDRLRTLALPRATETIPAGDRVGIASRWIARVGLTDPLTRVRDDSRPALIAASGLRALADKPGERAYIAGAPSAGALGARDWAAAVPEAVALAMPREARLAPRLGVERVHHVVAAALGRRLFIDSGFLVREASVDRGQLEPVQLEYLYAEIFTTRVDAALGRFSVDVLARAADLPGRLREYLTRATGSAPVPAWAAHYAARAHEARYGARALAALVEPHLRDTLRERHDEDWFRNPRAGETLSQAIGAMRTDGALAWAGEKALDPAPLARRVSEALSAARR